MSNPQDPYNQPNTGPNNFPPPSGYPNQPPPGYYQPQPGYPNQPPPPGYYQPQPGYPNQPPPGYGVAQMPVGFAPPPGYAGQMPPYGYGGGGSTPATLAKASFLQRVGASLIDGIIFIPVTFIVGIVFVLASLDSFKNGTGFGIGQSLLLSLLIILPRAIYEVLMVSAGQTLGDRAAKIRIMDSAGNPPGLNKSFIRYIVPLALSLVGSIINNTITYSSGNFSYTSGAVTTTNTGGTVISLLFNLIVLVGYLWMLWDPNKQTLFDKLAGTFVVKTL